MPAPLLQVALNGPRARDEHPALPVTADALAADAAACAAAGAGAVHLHPRDADGEETLDPEVVDATVRVVRAACRVPVGVSTGAWILPDGAARLAAVGGWSAPDFASVNLAEDWHAEVLAALLERGIGVEAGIATVEDVARLDATGRARAATRVLVEPHDEEPGDALTRADAIEAALGEAGVAAPRVHHGYGPATWAVLRAAGARGHGVRVGFEDVLTLPDGRRAASNLELVVAAAALD
jgi:uncharacterized protein (DUF849 family)